MPLAAPVTTATLPSRRIILLLAVRRCRNSGEIIVYDLAETQGQIGDDMQRRNDFEHRQLGDGREGMWVERERGRTGPRALHLHVLKIVLDQLANPRPPVD